MGKMRWVLAGALACFVTLGTEPVRAGAVAVSAIDFGDPANPEAGAPRSGASGVAFLTIKNLTTQSLERLAFDLEAGSCVRTLGPGFRLDALPAGQTVRMPFAFSVAFDPNCTEGTPASVLLTGAYSAAGSTDRLRDWSVFRFRTPRPGT